jgi:anti-anti-sigma regulatory factor
MAFKIFPKSTRRESPKGESGTGSDASRAAKHDAEPLTTISRNFSDAEAGGWAPQAGRIEVNEEGALSPSLENAALMFAHGNGNAATAALSHALETNERSQLLVWMCLFDLHARAQDRVAFDELALRFVVQFERSAPAWDELAPGGGNVVASMASRGGPKSLLRGDLTDPHSPVLVTLSEAAKRKVGPPPRFDLDIAELNGVNDVCGTLLAGALAALRRKGSIITFRALDATIRRLSVPLESGKPQHKGQWYLVLELLQWAGSTNLFDDRAVDFAITFEISPPTMEPLGAAQRNAMSVQTAAVDTPVDTIHDDRVIWAGELLGSTAPCINSISLANITTNPVIVDMRQVLRVDFICGSAIANAFTRLMAQAVDVRVVGASPIVQTLMQLTGTPAGLFAKTA